jgi:hypothetical protein
MRGVSHAKASAPSADAFAERTAAASSLFLSEPGSIRNASTSTLAPSSESDCREILITAHDRLMAFSALAPAVDWA